MFLDSHCHLADKKFDADRAEVIQRAKDAGLRYVLTVACNAREMIRNLEIADQNQNFFTAAGLHPHEAETFTEEMFEEFRSRYNHHKMLAIGEIGLDFWYDFSPREQQAMVFRRFLNLAMELDMPVIIHLRDPKDSSAATDLFRTILAEEDPDKKLRGIMHCYSGDYDLAMEMFERGFLISLPGILTFPKADEMKDIASRLPYESLLIETDSPYLAPVPFRGKRNEPAHAVETARELARLRGITENDLDRILKRNFEAMFRLEAENNSGEIAYMIRNSMYINLTNKCTANCTFCDRTKSATVSGYYLRLQHEPTAAEVLEAIGDPTKLDEVVFCGFGEPTIRLDAIKEIATELKKLNTRIRVNTAGHAELFHKRDILPELKGLVDEFSVSINSADVDEYVRLMRPYKGKAAFAAMQDFIRRAVELEFEVAATAVEIPGLDLASVEKLAVSLGAKWRTRLYNVVG